MNRLEVIVCVIVFLLIASFFLPSVRDARGTARRTQCLNNMRNIGIAVQNYATDHRGTTPATVVGDPPHSWRLHLMPYIESSSLYDDYQFDLAWDEGVNREPAERGVKIYMCPNEEVEYTNDGLSYSTYAAITGTNAMWGEEKSLTFEEVTAADGLSATILISEAAAEDFVWTEPRDVSLDTKKIGIELLSKPKAKSEFLISAYHDYSSNVIFGDGSGRHISADTEPRILKALCTATGGEKLTSADY